MCCITLERFWSSFDKGLEHGSHFGAGTAMHILHVSALETIHRNAVGCAVLCYAVLLCASDFDILTEFQCCHGF